MKKYVVAEEFSVILWIIRASNHKYAVFFRSRNSDNISYTGNEMRRQQVYECLSILFRNV